MTSNFTLLWTKIEDDFKIGTPPIDRVIGGVPISDCSDLKDGRIKFLKNQGSVLRLWR